MTSDPRLGQTVGDYLVQEVIGRGGMGVVYRATRRDGSETVALKLMLPELARNPSFRRRFVDEAEAAPRVSHPNVVPVYDFGEADGELFIAMELVEGYDLKKLLESEGRLAPKRALHLLEQAAAALDAAHEAGLVHGDVKPQNIMIANESHEDGSKEHVLLTDFGLIRPIASESTGSRSHEVFGSLQYMSPEQIEGMAGDGRADVYSLACVAYECLSGRIPFERPNEVSVLWAHIHEEPPRLVDVAPDLPGGLTDVIRQGLAKHPDDRYLTCGELVTALREGLKHVKVKAVAAPLRPLVTRVKRPKTEREVWAPNFFPELSRVRKVAEKGLWRRGVAFTGAFVIALVGAVQFVHPQGVSGSVRDVGGVVDSFVGGVRSIVGEDETQASSQERKVDGAAGNPESGRTEEGGGGQGSPVAGPGVAGSLDAPPGDNAPERGSEDTGSEDPTDPGSPPSDKKPSVSLPPSLSSTKIVFITDRHAGTHPAANEVYVMNADGTNVQRVTTDAAFDEYSPAISPDGERVAWVSNRGGDYDIHVMNIDGSNVRQLTHTPGVWEVEPEWSPDGSQILFGDAADYVGDASDADIWVMNSDGTGKRNLTGTPNTFESGADWSPDGARIVFDRDGAIYTMSPTGGDVRLVARTAGAYYYYPTWCQNGYIFASAFVEDAGSPTDIFRIDARTGESRRLTNSPSRDQFPSCSPDGTKVVFTSRRLGGTNEQIFVMNTDGSEQTRVLESPWSDGDASWQPNF